MTFWLENLTEKHLGDSKLGGVIYWKGSQGNRLYCEHVNWIELAQHAICWLCIKMPPLLSGYTTTVHFCNPANAAINHVWICERPSRLFRVTFYCLSEGIKRTMDAWIKAVWILCGHMVLIPSSIAKICHGFRLALFGNAMSLINSLLDYCSKHRPACGRL